MKENMIKDVFSGCNVCGEIKEKGISFAPPHMPKLGYPYDGLSVVIFVCEDCIGKMKKMIEPSNI